MSPAVWDHVSYTTGVASVDSGVYAVGQQSVRAAANRVLAKVAPDRGCHPRTPGDGHRDAENALLPPTRGGDGARGVPGNGGSGGNGVSGNGVPGNGDGMIQVRIGR